MASLEIEFKNLLTASEYADLKQSYPFGHPFRQQNFYFDTAVSALRRINCGLRIRIFADYAEQTLKIPAPLKSAAKHQLYEITDRLTVAQAQQLVAQQQIMAPSQVATALAARQIDRTQLQLIGSGSTLRCLAPLAAGDLTLDQTSYPNQRQDFELELETTTPATSVTFYHELLQQHQIPQRPRQNKVARAVAEFHTAGHQQTGR